MTEADKLRRELFTALAYDEGKEVFFLHPNNLGFGFELAPLASNDPAIGVKLNTLVNLAFPVGTLLQVSMYASPDIEAALESYGSMRQGTRDPVLKRLTRERIQFLRRATEQPVDRVSGVLVHDVKIVLSVRLPTAGAEPGERDYERAAELAAAAAQTLRSSGLQARPLTAARYLRFMATCLNHKPTASWRETTHERYEPTRLLCDQILDADSDITADAKGLWLGEEKRVRLLHVKEYPGYLDFGDAMRFLGDFITGERGIREPVVMSANLHYVDHDSTNARFQTDHALVSAQMQRPAARFITSFRKRHESLQAATAAAEDGDRFVQVYFGMALLARNEEHAVGAATNAKTYFRELGFRLLEDRFFCRELFFALLPFAATPALRTSLARFITVPSRSAVNLMPILGAWPGTGDAMLTLFSRDGQLMPVSPYDSDSNYNICIAAASGSGKSFLVNELITNFLATGGRVWAIDIGNSYRNLCSVLGGQYLQFTNQTRVNLCPFATVEDYEEESDVLVGILTAMAAPTQSLTDLQAAELRRITRLVWDDAGRAATVDLLAQRLLEHKQERIQDIGRQLYPFTQAGEYGRFFRSDNPPLRSDANFTVCELEELRGREHLLRVVLMQLMALIQHEMYLGARSVPKLLVVDEAWDLLARSQARGFITGSYRRARKYRGTIATITQSVMDYWRNDGAQAIVENSANWYLLRQKSESIAEVEREKRLPFGPAGYTLLQSLRTVPGEYSEIFAITDRGAGIGRLVVSDFNRLLYSTTPAQVEAIASRVAAGYTTEQAIEELLLQQERQSARA